MSSREESSLGVLGTPLTDGNNVSSSLSNYGVYRFNFIIQTSIRLTILLCKLGKFNVYAQQSDIGHYTFKFTWILKEIWKNQWLKCVNHRSILS